MRTASMDTTAHTRQPALFAAGADVLGEPTAGARQQQGHGGDRHLRCEWQGGPAALLSSICRSPACRSSLYGVNEQVREGVEPSCL
jgi:hypothetical protein